MDAKEVITDMHTTRTQLTRQAQPRRQPLVAIHQTAFCFACLVSLAAGTLLAQSPLIVAHRGASSSAPENTLAAFNAAWTEGADAIEGDFHLTADGKIVCIHDADTLRVTEERIERQVASSTLAELQALDVGSWKGAQFASQRVPTIDDVIQQVPAKGIIYVEIKCGPEIVEPLENAVRESQLVRDQIRIISFKADVIDACKNALPEIDAYWLVDFKRSEGSWQPTAEEIVSKARELHADGVDVKANVDLVDEHFIAVCRAAGLSIHVWTVNEPDTAQHFARLGVDSITTNHPSLVGAAVRGEKAQ